MPCMLQPSGKFLYVACFLYHQILGSIVGAVMLIFHLPSLSSVSSAICFIPSNLHVLKTPSTPPISKLPALNSNLPPVRHRWRAGTPSGSNLCRLNHVQILFPGQREVMTVCKELIDKSRLFSAPDLIWNSPHPFSRSQNKPDPLLPDLLPVFLIRRIHKSLQMTDRNSVTTFHQ